ncbi:MAG: nucleotide exchange factor GrpE [Deltaproteobacteria bacterium]|nr:nucleotide exchange factor GrpE [Deltaproteobacteria bacterium]
MSHETPKTNKQQDAKLEPEKKQNTLTETEDQPDSLTPEDKSVPTSEDVSEETDWEVEAKKYQDLYLRATAEQENLKKRLGREKDETIKFANESLIKELLPIVDNLERAINHAENKGENQEGMLEGIRMTYQSFMDILKKFGIQPIAAMGEKFNPQFHEAVMQEEDPDSEDGTVIREIQRGYFLKDRLIRPAMVVVSKRT